MLVSCLVDSHQQYLRPTNKSGGWVMGVYHTGGNGDKHSRSIVDPLRFVPDAKTLMTVPFYEVYYPE